MTLYENFSRGFMLLFFFLFFYHYLPTVIIISIFNSKLYIIIVWWPPSCFSEYYNTICIPTIIYLYMRVCKIERLVNSDQR